FLFQAEDGIRDFHVTGVQTCALPIFNKLKDRIGFESLRYDDRIGKVSLIGAGMRSHPGVTAKFFNAIAEAGVNIEMISTSEIRRSEERRVGKEWRGEWLREHVQTKQR